MKNGISILLIVFVLLSFSGCTKNKNPKSIYSGNKQLITLGMSKSDIDGILGQGDKEGSSFYLYDNNIILVFYENDISRSILISRSNKYNDYMGIKIGDNYNISKETFSEKYIAEDNAKSCFIIKVDKDKQLIEKYDKSSKNDFSIVYQKDEKSDKLGSILIDNKY